MHIICPHCRSPIEIVGDAPADEVVCAVCGSTFRVDARGSTAQARLTDGPLEIGRFRVVGMLGVGAFGTVYKARDGQLERDVAIKVPRAGNLGSSGDRDRFLREARSVAQLRHAGIVPVHEVGQADGVPYLVSEYVAGVTLADWLTAHRPTFRQAAAWVAAVADALHYAHAQGIVHRDIKPTNIMLEAPAEAPRVMDFGLAKRDAGEITVTTEGQVLGTPAYMAPEQARGESHTADARSDVYSLGVILYELLAGGLPFRGNQRMLLHQVLHDEARPPRKLNDAVPRDLETVCLKAMEKDPAKRYATAGELAAELRRWLAGEPILARPVGQFGRTWRWARRNPGVAALTTAVMGLLLALAVGSSLTAAHLAGLNADLVTARADAETRATDATLAAARESKALGELRAVSDRERQALKDNRRLLARIAVANGHREHAQGNGLTALVWFAAALEHVAGDAEYEPTARVRLALHLRPLPKLTHFLAMPGNRSDLVALPSAGRAVLRRSDDGPCVFDLRTGEPVPEFASVQRLRHVEASGRGDRYWLLVSDGSGGPAARAWDAASGRPLGPAIPVDPADPSFARVDLSPDGQRMVLPVMGARTELQFWDVETGRPVGTPLRHPLPVRLARFSRDGKRFVTAHLADPLSARTLATAARVFRLWDPRTGAAAAEPCPLPPASYSTWSPDGRWLLVGTEDGKAVRLHDLVSGQMRRDFADHGRPTRGSFVEDGRTLATWNGREAHFWDLETLAPARPPIVLDAGAAPSEPAAANDSWLVLRTPLADKERCRIALVNLETGRRLNTLVESLANGSVAIDDAGGVILTEPHKGQLQWWGLRNGRPLSAPWRAPQPFWSFAVAGGAPGEALTWGERELRGWALPTDPSPAATAAPDAWPPYILPDPRRFVQSRGNALQLYEVRAGDEGSAPHNFPVLGDPGMEQFRLVRGFEQKTFFDERSIQFSRDGRRLLSAGLLIPSPEEGQDVRVWDVATGQLVGPPIRPATRIAHVALSPDGNHIALVGEIVAAAGSTRVAVYDAITGAIASELDAGPGWVRRVAFSGDGTRLAAVGYRASQVLDVATRRAVGPALPPADAVTFSPDGRRVALVREGVVRIWEVATGQPVSPEFALGVPKAELSALDPPHAAFSPDGRLLATAAGRLAQVWEVATGQPLGPPWVHPTAIDCAVFSPDGRRVVTSHRKLVLSLVRRDPGVPPLFAWDVPTIDWPADDLARFARLHAGQTLNAYGEPIPLDPAEAVAAWRQLSARRRAASGLPGPTAP